MDSALKQRLIGAAVLVALAMIFLPMLLKGPDPSRQDAAQVPLDAPAAPDQPFETREVPLTLPAPELRDGAALAPDSAGAVVTVDPAAAAPRVDFDPATPEDDGQPLAAIDPATGEPLAPEPEPAPAAASAPAASPAPGDTVTTPAAPLPAATAGGRYAVNAGSFSNLDNARSLAGRLRAQGLPVTSESVDVGGKPAMRLRVGPYAERTLAEAARLRVEGITGGEASVVALDAAPASPAPATRPAAAANVGFAVQLGALSSQADADALRDRARAAGFVAFHQQVNTDRGIVWRVRVGPEADRAAAERLRDTVAARLGLADPIVVSHP
jgi:cell division septation protein DedD